MGMVLEAGESIVLRIAGHSLVLPEVSRSDNRNLHWAQTETTFSISSRS